MIQFIIHFWNRLNVHMASHLFAFDFKKHQFYSTFSRNSFVVLVLVLSLSPLCRNKLKINFMVRLIFWHCCCSLEFNGNDETIMFSSVLSVCTVCCVGVCVCGMVHLRWH